MFLCSVILPSTPNTGSFELVNTGTQTIPHCTSKHSSKPLKPARPTSSEEEDSYLASESSQSSSDQETRQPTRESRSKRSLTPCCQRFHDESSDSDRSHHSEDCKQGQLLQPQDEQPSVSESEPQLTGVSVLCSDNASRSSSDDTCVQPIQEQSPQATVSVHNDILAHT